ncbi:MAG: C39 family peptidase [Chloroflexi bacterium]|nr:C39 family peptidase [Chloroflexota bacterium]
MRLVRLLLLFAGFLLLAALLYQIPAVNSRLAWRLDFARTGLRLFLDPPGNLPTAAPQVAAATATPLLAATPTPVDSIPTAIPPTPTPLPASVQLPAPAWEQQGPNNCGPATLALYLRTFGWEGSQYDISDIIKPESADRNVNVEELAYWARNYTGWLNTQYRVGGNLETLKRFIAGGLPIMIEEGTYLEETYWPDDDHWSGHYLLLTGYDDDAQTFTAQDTFLGPDRRVTYARLLEGWEQFNYVYIFLYLPGQEAAVVEILGPDWDADANRQRALEASQAATQADPENAFAWFNLGSNLVYFERYGEAAEAYDQARALGLPQRMLRYQFGPFHAYFQTNRLDDLFAIVDYALQITPNSEEANLWQGWGYYRLGDNNRAIEAFRRAYWANIYSFDAQYALDFMGASP